MKLKSSYNLIKQNDTYIIEPIMKTANLSEIGVFLWNILKDKDLNNAELLNLLLENFEISTVLALGEIDTFIKSMKENGIIE